MMPSGRGFLQAYMDEFQKEDAAFSFANMVVTEERKLLVFIQGIKLSKDQRYIMHQKCKHLMSAMRLPST